MKHILRFRKSDDNVKNKLLKTYCNSIYVCNLWSRYHNVAINMLISAYGYIFRTLFNFEDKSTTILKMVELGIDPVDVIVRQSAGSFYCRLLDSEIE